MTVEEFMNAITGQIADWGIHSEMVNEILVSELEDKGDVSHLTIDKLVVDFEHNSLTFYLAEFPDNPVTIA